MVAAVGAKTSQTAVLSAANFPAVGGKASQAAVITGNDAKGYNARITQTAVLVAARGQIADPYVRVWGYEMDAHRVVVWRLPNPVGKTLVYDMQTRQFSIFGSYDTDIWKAFTGTNWVGGEKFAGIYGSNVLVGDDANGSFYFLDPTRFTDDDPIYGSATQRNFLREVTGQVLTKDRNYMPCFGVRVEGSIGEQDGYVTLTDVTLSTSDDKGHTYDNQGTIGLTADDYTAWCEWGALGSFPPPGRLFKISDYGALQRIDAVEMLEDPEQEDDK